MKRIAIAVLSVALCGAGGAFAQDDSKALFEETCGKCHGLDGVVNQRNTREHWSAVVDDMITRGAEGTDAAFEKIVDYLAKNYGPKVNVNKATAQELARALDVPESTGTAVVEYRTKHGSFKTLQDLKKTPALQGTDIDSKKDRLDFSEAP